MISNAEAATSRFLRAALMPLPVDALIHDSKEFRSCLSSLESFVPEVLLELYPAWKFEGLDGIYPAVARKTGEREAEVLGMCILVVDQDCTPIQVRIRHSILHDEIEWMQCCLGEQGDGKGGMRRFSLEDSTGKILFTLEQRASAIKWVYKVEFGAG